MNGHEERESRIARSSLLHNDDDHHEPFHSSLPLFSVLIYLPIIPPSTSFFPLYVYLAMSMSTLIVDVPFRGIYSSSSSFS